VVNAGQIGDAFGLIFYYAFNPHGSGRWVCWCRGDGCHPLWCGARYFLQRSRFGERTYRPRSGNNENPVRQGLIAMLGTFIDTIIVCTITALVILTSTVWMEGEAGASLTALSFDAALPGFGNQIVAIALAIFAFTTILGWSFYGE
ncbi:sodium:alanine symporter, partial [Halomonas sp. SUBG004]